MARIRISKLLIILIISTFRIAEMTSIERLHHEAIFFKNHKPFMTEIKIYQAVLKDPRCPRPARWLLAAAIAYTISPIDLIPDFIPVIGHLDDILIVPAIS